MKFIDLFAGIGGFHLALSKLGMKCVFASEIDPFAREVYIKNHKIELDIFNEDIRTVTPELIPDHDILCAGFPCQPFSLVGKKRGFNDLHDSERGNLFFYIEDILKVKRPNAFILENVRHLIKHDGGNTFRVIIDTLTELNYTVYYKVIKASDFGLPQHRPRVFIVGFNNETINNEEPFLFPEPIGLKMTMSDIFKGECTRDIGFTIRVGGKGSSINDRRNWDGYVVNGEVVRLSPVEGLKMMGFPDDFILSSSKIQAMKQLGNSVCVDVVFHVANSVKNYLIRNKKNMKKNLTKNEFSFNKGEWSEFYAFIKMIKDPVIYFGDISGNKKNDSIIVRSLRHNNGNTKYILSNPNIIPEKRLRIITLNREGVNYVYHVDELIPDHLLEFILDSIINGNKASFNISDFNLIKALNIESFKGKSNEKQDLLIDFLTSDNILFKEQGISLKSFLGKSPTLLNASFGTNFIYKVLCPNNINIEDVNSIDGNSKIRDRIKFIINNGGNFKFIKCEKNVFQNNLSLVDGDLPKIMSDLLFEFYSKDESMLNKLVTGDAQRIKVTRLLTAISLGMFPSSIWDGRFSANGIVVIRKKGDLIIYHTLDINTLNDYLFNNIKLDTPSSGRHKFGCLYLENGELFFKLNLQLRHIN